MAGRGYNGTLEALRVLRAWVGEEQAASILQRGERREMEVSGEGEAAGGAAPGESEERGSAMRPDPGRDRGMSTGKRGWWQKWRQRCGGNQGIRTIGYLCDLIREIQMVCTELH